ncbi:hypothetical protein LDENG_00161980 [Lucifuga dentata]|nr:hypothetical protein LDENG_00161980 [Lucifuga dentata]
MLQAYQAEKLQDLHQALSKGENPLAILDEARRTADFILRLSSTAAIVLGRGMAETVVAQSHLWLTLNELPEGRIAPKKPEESTTWPSELSERRDRPQAQPKQSAWTKLHVVPRQAEAPRPSAVERTDSAGTEVGGSQAGDIYCLLVFFGLSTHRVKSRDSQCSLCSDAKKTPVKQRIVHKHSHPHTHSSMLAIKGKRFLLHKFT